MIDRFLLQKLTVLPIESVASRLGMAVSHHKCLCPFHEDRHPSLTFDRRRNRFRCYVCGEYGNGINLVMKMRHVGFVEACRWLEGEGEMVQECKGSEVQECKYKPFDASRYARFFEHPFLNDDAKLFLYDERRLDPRVVRWCRITSWRDKQDVNWLQIPYYDMDMKLIGVQNRNLDWKKEQEFNDSNVQDSLSRMAAPFGGRVAPRFRFPYGSRCSIYNLPVLPMLRQNEPLYITEGCSDCWAMLSAGRKAIAIPSATLLKASDMKLFDTLISFGTTFHMYPDQDEPGERLFLQLKQFLPNIIRHQLPIGCKDFSDYYKLIHNSNKNEHNHHSSSIY